MSLNSIPQELIQNVASYLEDDRDLVSLRLSCTSTAAAIDARPAHFWMYRFREHFDPPRTFHSLDDLKTLYQQRKKVLRVLPWFKHGNTRPEIRCLQHLLDIIYDANPSSANAYGVPTCKNFELLDRIMRTTNILQCIFQRLPDSTASKAIEIPQRKKSKSGKAAIALTTVKKNITTLQTFQLLMSSRCLSFINPNPIVLSFPESQRAAYMDFESTPLFSGYGGLEVNMEWALHIVNFFRYHTLRDEEATLCPAFRDLNKMYEGTEMPQLWKKQLSNKNDPIPLGRHWKGSYAYLLRKEVNEIRRAKEVGEQAYEDHNVDLGHKAIQELKMDFGKTDRRPVWPKAFEYHLQGKHFLERAANKIQSESWTPPRATRGRPQIVHGPERPENLKSHYYDVEGWDDETFWASGWINQLPTQRNIPGFKRMTMMKYFTDHTGAIDYDALWAYEGIVLPGDQIIVGRWWSPEAPIQLHKIYSGPFILWNTDCGANFKEVHKGEIAAIDVAALTQG